MKATGIVRRIDDLGRVVIPKEIRRTLRIREGDPLEIFVDRDGEVILKKYSPIGELGNYAAEFAESLHDALGHIALVADQDAIIAVAGAPRKEFLDRRIGGVIEGAMRHRQTVVVNDVEGEKPFPGTLLFDDEDDRRVAAYIAAPIVVGDEAIGAVILCTRDPDRKMGDLERTLVETAATFLAKQMQ
ncbi:MAG: stage V sporulation protein T [Thermaerobacter sp.]|nr:stage V sporulation protein T [Bacillota bacterium]REJ37018.1 MAG: stage V sporulation protein T [Bacillota bacterium]